MSSKLFSSVDVGPVRLHNRIAVSPMCQYSATNGEANDWHLMNLMQLGISNAGLIMLERRPSSRVRASRTAVSGSMTTQRKRHSHA